MDLNPFLPIITYVASMRKSWRRCLATILPFSRVQRLKRVADVLEANSRDILAGKYAQAAARGDFTHTDILSSLSKLSFAVQVPIQYSSEYASAKQHEHR